MADSSAASTTSTASTVSPFLKKTYDILSNPEYEKVCGWGDNNDSVFIKDIDEFAKTVLPKYFKHSNYASFKRQLHKYDFHKTVHNARHGEFKHPYFVRDSPELMVKIQRKIYVKKNVVPVSDVGNTDGETDASSEKGSSKSGQDKDDADFDFDFMDDDNNNLFELDFEAFDSVETSVEQGLIEFDNERITVLEKRQADLMDENIATREELKDTLQMNKHISRAMDIMVCATMCTMQKKEAIVCPPCDNGKCVANVDDVCEEFSAQCKMDSLTEEEMEELKNIL